MTELPTILLVDDSADDRELLALVLRGAFGGEPAIAAAPDAVSLARAVATGSFGLVVAEHALSWIRAGDLVRLVRDLRPGVPVVVLTASPLAEVASELIHLPPDAVVPKTSAGWVDLPKALRRVLRDAARPAAQPATSPGAAEEHDELAYVVAHDLRQPATPVARFHDRVAGRAGAGLDQAARELLAAARRGARSLEARVDGLQRYAALGRDGAVAPVELAPLLARVLERLGEEGATAGAEVTHDPLPTVVASAPQMEQLLRNLVGNALKFRRGGSVRVHVGCEAANGESDAWHLFVRDDGIGLAPRDGERIFGLFQRLHTEAEFPGSGIGLALCRRIVARHGGRIWVESQPGAGATFHFTLARRGDPQASSAHDGAVRDRVAGAEG